MDRLTVMMVMLVMSVLVNTTVTQSVPPGRCEVQDGIFSCSETETADIIRSIQQSDLNTIDVIDIFHCNMSWISEEVFVRFFAVTEVQHYIALL